MAGPSGFRASWLPLRGAGNAAVTVYVHSSSRRGVFSTATGFRAAAEPGENRAQPWRFSGAACFLLEGQLPRPRGRTGLPPAPPESHGASALHSAADVTHRLSLVLRFVSICALPSIRARERLFQFVLLPRLRPAHSALIFPSSETLVRSRS